jgi:hypothetical protein
MLGLSCNILSSHIKDSNGLIFICKVANNTFGNMVVVHWEPRGRKRAKREQRIWQQQEEIVVGRR